MTERDDSSVQSLIDALSLALGRSVLLDDPSLAPLAFSRQWDVDGVRSESILGRGVAADVREELLGQGIASATDIFHTARVPELGMDERACMPVRHDGEMLGYIWLLDPHSDLSDDALDRIRSAARQIGRMLAGQNRLKVPDETTLLEDLRSSEPEVRERAAGEALTRGLRLDDPLVVCQLAASASAGDAWEMAQKSVRRLTPGHAVAASAGDRAAIVVSLADPILRTLPSAEVGTWVRTALEAPVAVGASAAAPLSSLNEAWHQALVALKVACSEARPEVVAWDTIGADRLVAQLPPHIVGDLPEPLLRLIEDESELTVTLEVFLDAGGDVKSTAQSLALHRSGLYYRLRRIEQVTHLDLSKGEDRLLAHLAIRIKRLVG